MLKIDPNEFDLLYHNYVHSTKLLTAHFSSVILHKYFLCPLCEKRTNYFFFTFCRINYEAENIAKPKFEENSFPCSLGLSLFIVHSLNIGNRKINFLRPS